MKISNARYLDSDHKHVEAVIDGVTVQEVIGGNGDRRIREWIEGGGKPSKHVKPPEPKAPTIAEKLARLGITADELKSLLK